MRREPVCLLYFGAPKMRHGDVINEVIEQAIKDQTT